MMPTGARREPVSACVVPAYVQTDVVERRVHPWHSGRGALRNLVHQQHGADARPSSRYWPVEYPQRLVCWLAAIRALELLVRASRLWSAGAWNEAGEL